MPILKIDIPAQVHPSGEVQEDCTIFAPVVSVVRKDSSTRWVLDPRVDSFVTTICDFTKLNLVYSESSLYLECYEEINGCETFVRLDVQSAQFVEGFPEP